MLHNVFIEWGKLLHISEFSWVIQLLIKFYWKRDMNKFTIITRWKSRLPLPCNWIQLWQWNLDLNKFQEKNELFFWIVQHGIPFIRSWAVNCKNLLFFFSQLKSFSNSSKYNLVTRTWLDTKTTHMHFHIILNDLHKNNYEAHTIVQT